MEDYNLQATTCSSLTIRRSLHRSLMSLDFLLVLLLSAQSVQFGVRTVCIPHCSYILRSNDFATLPEREFEKGPAFHCHLVGQPPGTRLCTAFTMYTVQGSKHHKVRVRTISQSTVVQSNKLHRIKAIVSSDITDHSLSPACAALYGSCGSSIKT